ncbi:MAG: hypothetical protein HOP29_05975 [Phycisphaerales bacterium]|nr:hypothetical protein [Phycisphaerales bacterium]
MGVGIGMAMGVVHGCDGFVTDSVLSGIRDGAVTTTTGLIDGYFADRFGLDGGEEEAVEEGGGNDLFIGL